MSKNYDAIIIGAGHNSLVCAAELARRSWRVLVLEQAQTAGGAVKTLELTEPGFRHDWAAMNLSLFAGSPFHKENAAALAGHGLAFVPAQNCFASVFPDGRWLGVTTGSDATRNRISGFSENDAKAWDGLVADFPKTAEYLFAVLGSPMKMHVIAKTFAKAWWKHGFAWTGSLVRLMLSSPRAWLEETFESDHVRATLAAWGMHLDFAPDISGGAIFPYLESMANQAFGMVIGKGGADTLTTSLCGLVTAAGGTIRTGARVTRILRDGDRAIGVEIEGGETVHAAKAVIANVAPRNLVDGLLGGSSGDVRFDKAMRSFAHAPGTMMIHLSLDALPDWAASPELKTFAYVHIASSLDQMAKTYQQAKAGLLPDEPVIVVGQPTAIDPSRAPEGKHVLWVQVRMAPGEILGDAGGAIAARDWDNAAEPFADRVLAMIERHAPGFQASIRKRLIVTPKDLEADNPNLVGGDQICGSHHLSQHFIFRPALGNASGETPIKGLHLTGAAVWPGAGTGAGSGTMLARSLTGK